MSNSTLNYIKTTKPSSSVSQKREGAGPRRQLDFCELCVLSHSYQSTLVLLELFLVHKWNLILSVYESVELLGRFISTLA